MGCMRVITNVMDSNNIYIYITPFYMYMIFEKVKIALKIHGVIVSLLYCHKAWWVVSLYLLFFPHLLPSSKNFCFSFFFFVRSHACSYLSPWNKALHVLSISLSWHVLTYSFPCRISDYPPFTDLDNNMQGNDIYWHSLQVCVVFW